MRTLPLRLAPVNGESLPGYIARYAHTFALQPGDVRRALGLNSGSGGGKGARHYGVWLSREQLEHASAASGIASETLQGMLLERFAGRAFARREESSRDALSGEGYAREVLIQRSRYCPDCLREDGAWLLRWQLGWCIVCLRHRALLLHRCPRCGDLPRLPMQGSWPHDLAGELHDPSRCLKRREGGLCRASFPDTTAQSVHDAALLDAQRHIDAVLDGEIQPTLAGQDLQPRSYLRDLRALAGLLHRWRNPYPRAARELFDNPPALARVLAEAVRLAELPNRAALAQGLREIGDARYRATGEKLPLIHELRGISVPMREALRRARGESIWTRESRRLGIDPGGYRRADDLHPDLHPCHVPQLFWASDYHRELAELFDFLRNPSDRRGRRFCSVLLARMLAALNWVNAIDYLDLPEDSLNRDYLPTDFRLRQKDRLQELAKRIRKLANEHAANGLIDYEQRRGTLSDWAGIDPQTWLLLQPHAQSPGTTQGDLPNDRVHASVWLWCELIGGDEVATPSSLPPLDPDAPTRLIHDITPELRGRLLLLGELLLSTPTSMRETIPTRLAAILDDRGPSSPCVEPKATVNSPSNCHLA